MVNSIRRAQRVLAKCKQKIVDHLLVVQGALFVLTALVSAMVFFPLGTITGDFDGQCLLFASIHLIGRTNSNVVTVDLAKTKYGSEDDCDLTTYINVAVAITDVMFLWFLIHYRHVKGRERSEVKLQAPVFIFHLALFITVFVSSVKITTGFHYWCDHLYLRSNQASRKESRIHCKEFKNFEWDSTDGNRARFYSYSYLAMVATWMSFTLLLLQCCVTCVRLCKNYSQIFSTMDDSLDKTKPSAGESSDKGMHNLAADSSESVHIRSGSEHEMETYNVTVHEGGNGDLAVGSSSTEIHHDKDLGGKSVNRQRKKKLKMKTEHQPILYKENMDEADVDRENHKTKEKPDQSNSDEEPHSSETLTEKFPQELERQRQSSDSKSLGIKDSDSQIHKGEMELTSANRDQESREDHTT